MLPRGSAGLDTELRRLLCVSPSGRYGLFVAVLCRGANAPLRLGAHRQYLIPKPAEHDTPPPDPYHHVRSLALGHLIVLFCYNRQKKKNLLVAVDHSRTTCFLLRPYIVSLLRAKIPSTLFATGDNILAFR